MEPHKVLGLYFVSQSAADLMLFLTSNIATRQLSLSILGGKLRCPWHTCRYLVVMTRDRRFENVAFEMGGDSTLVTNVQRDAHHCLRIKSVAKRATWVTCGSTGLSRELCPRTLRLSLFNQPASSVTGFLPR
jgi:hypothetical protein